MRVSFIKLLHIFSKKRSPLLRVVLPLSFFVLLFLCLPQLSFASDDWVAEQIASPLLSLSGGMYSFGFTLVQTSVQITATIVSNPTIGKVWGNVRTLSLSLFGLGILAIAFMNLMRVQIQTWGVNRTIPRLVFGVFLIIFSKFICISIINFATALASSFSKLGGVGIFSNLAKMGEAISLIEPDSVSLIFVFFLLLVCFVCMLLLALLAGVLLFRAALLAFLIITAPLAFALFVLPITEKYTSEWWKIFTKWTFFFPICILFLTIGMELTMATLPAWQADADPTTNFGGAKSKEFLDTFIPMIIGFVAIPLSIWFPLKMLGAVGKSAQGLMSKTGSKFNPGRVAKDKWGQRQENKKEGRKNKSPLFGTGIVGRAISGRNKFTAAALDYENSEAFGKLPSAAREHFDNHKTMRGYSGPGEMAAKGWERKAGRIHGARRAAKTYNSTYAPGTSGPKHVNSFTSKQLQGAHGTVLDNLDYHYSTMVASDTDRMLGDGKIKGGTRKHIADQILATLPALAPGATYAAGSKEEEIYNSVKKYFP